MELHAASASAEISRSYVRRAPERGVLHRVVREQLQIFLWELDQHHDERGAPLFVKREFLRFVRCGGAGAWVCPLSVYGLWHRSFGRVLLQRSRLLPELWGADA